MFGLNPNVEYVERHDECKVFGDYLLSLDPKNIFNKGKSDELYHNQAFALKIKEKFSAILATLPGEVNLKDAEKKFPILFEDSMNTILRQELQHYDAVFRKINSSLQEGMLMMDGKIEITKSLQKLCEDVLNNRIPDHWGIGCEKATKSLSVWLADLINRLKLVEIWARQGPPSVFLLSAFWNIKAFLTAVKLNYSRRKVVQSHKIGFEIEYINKDPKDIKSPPDLGAYIHGLFLENAGWSREENKLIEAKISERYTMMPIVNKKYSIFVALD